MIHFSECSTVAENCNTETQIEMRDGTAERFPGGAWRRRSPPGTRAAPLRSPWGAPSAA